MCNILKSFVIDDSKDDLDIYRRALRKSNDSLKLSCDRALVFRSGSLGGGGGPVSLKYNAIRSGGNE